MKNTIWQKVQPGQIVSFLYRSKNSTKTERRIVLCLDPEYTYRKKSTKRNIKLFIGLQLETSLRGPVNARTLDQAISLLGGVRLDKGVVEVGNLGDDLSDVKTDDLLEKVVGLKRFVKKNDVFRTYLLRECRKKRVFLVDNYERLPAKYVKQIIKEQNLEKLTDEN